MAGAGTARAAGRQRRGDPVVPEHPHAGRPPLRQPRRHRAQQRAGHAGGPRHDAGHRDPRHRPLGRRDRRDRRSRRLHPDSGRRRRRCPGHRRDGVHLRDRGLHRARRLERLPGLGARHPADHRLPGADGCRARDLDGDHRRADHHRQQQLLQRPRLRLRADPPGRVPDRAGRLRPDRAADPSDGARHADRVGGHQPGGQPARGGPVAHDHLDRLRVLGLLLRRRGPGHRGQHQLGQRQQPRPLDRARRDPRRRHRRHLARRWPLLAHRHPDRRAVHRHPGPHDPQHRDPVGAQLPVQGRRRDRRLPPPVAEGPRGAPQPLVRPRHTPSSRRQVLPHERRHRPAAPTPRPPPGGTGSRATARPPASCP